MILDAMYPEVKVNIIDEPSLRMQYFIVPWDSEIFGFPVVQIDEIELRLVGAEAPFLEFEKWCKSIGAQLVSCRIPHDRLSESGFLERRHFRFIEMIFKPRIDLVNEIEGLESDLDKRPHLSISVASRVDIPEIDIIARSAFVTGRFILDANIDKQKSGERYAQWVRSALADSRYVVVKATLDGEIAGFFVTEERADGLAYWHLTAIAPSYQGRGIGKFLWRQMMLLHQNNGLRAIETTISAHNTPVINLYARLGFRFGEAQMTFHRTDDPLNA